MHNHRLLLSRDCPSSRSQYRARGISLAAFTAWLLLAMPAAAQQSAACANPAPATPSVTISPTMFDDVCIPPGFGGNPIVYFDDFSWRAFLALVWPAKQDQRGKPDTALPIGPSGKPTVFETFKSEWEVFQPNGKAPAPWAKYAGDNPCGIANVVFGDVLLASFSKFANLGQAGFNKDLTGALVARNGTYVRYSIGYNESEFSKILAAKAFLRPDLEAGVSFQPGAVDIKAAWIDMKNIPNPDRYHTRKAFLFDLEANSCAEATVGLAGFHIVVKTATRPQWIWTTFEHVDTVPSTGAAGPFLFNDGSGAAMPATNPVVFPIPLKPPAPYNVERIKPIHNSTADTNTLYRQALKAAGSKWQFYQLVMTQWPRAASAPTQTGTPNNTFPGRAPANTPPPPFDATAFSNTTMETFEQKNVATGCMSCHNAARVQADFLWSLVTRAHPSVLQIPESQQPSPMAESLSGRAALRSVEIPPGQAQALQELRELLDASRN